MKILKTVLTLGILLSVLLSLRIYYLRPVIEITGSKACLPEHLHHKTHTDWEFKKQTPWHTNVICDHGPPLQVWGNQDYWSVAENKRIGPKPIPRPGEWQLSRKTFPTHKGPRDLYYFAFTVHIFGEWYHFRVAEFRWDDVDGYYIFFSAASKFLPIAWERLLWHRQNG